MRGSNSRLGTARRRSCAKRSRKRSTAPGPKLIVPGAIEDYQSGLALILVVDLAADLAAWMARRVDVDVGHARPDGLNNRSDVSGRYSLRRNPEDIGGGDRPRHHRLAGCAGRAGRLGPTAEERSDTASQIATSEVDMGGDCRRRKTAVRQLVGDDASVFVDLGSESS